MACAGTVGAGDEIKLIGRDPSAVPVSDITRLYITKRYAAEDVTAVRKVLGVENVPESWKAYFRDRLKKMNP